MLRSALPLALALLAVPVLAQTDGFLVTDTAGDTLFYAAPDGTVLYGPDDARVQVTAGGEGLTSTVTRATGDPSAGIFAIDNAANQGAALLGITHGAGIATSGWTFGEGTAGGFFNYDGGNASPALWSFTQGTGQAVLGEQNGPSGNGGEFRITDAANASSAVYARTVGTGGAGSFFIDNPSNGFSAVFGRTNGTGAGVQGRNVGTGSAVVGIKQSDTGKAGEFRILNDDNDDFALDVFTQGAGSAVFGTATSGRGGQFLNVDPATTAPALEGVTYGTGVAFRAIQNSGGGTTVADFVTADDYSNFNVVARVDTDGNVYADGAFNGGGADFAERFEVVGGVAAYEVGDVLAIATSADRHLERSAEPYSTRILGVYATRPGVLLGDPSISEDATVPVGVVGVVPTKVTGEGGPIRRGDLLVTSSTAGHAMRGEPGCVGVGMVIGKALQDFDGAAGVIEVMVNVQ